MRKTFTKKNLHIKCINITNVNKPQMQSCLSMYSTFMEGIEGKSNIEILLGFQKKTLRMLVN